MRPSPIRAPGRSVVTTCSAASSLNTWPTGTARTRRPAWMAPRAGKFGSIVSRGAAVGELFGGKSLSQEWKDWIAAERGEALRLRDRLQAIPPVSPRRAAYVACAHQTAFPRVSPDGTVAFLATDEGRNRGVSMSPILMRAASADCPGRRRDDSRGRARPLDLCLKSSWWITPACSATSTGSRVRRVRSAG